MKTLNLSFLFFLLTTGLHAYSDFGLDYNRPGEKWFHSSTAHFDVYYLNGLKEYAEDAASIGEEVYGYYTEKYKIKLPGKLNLIIYDEDYSNGYAWSSANTIKIWVSGADFEMRGVHHWLHDVVVHEFGHIVSIQAGQKTRYNIPDFRFGYFDYFNEKIQTSFFTVYSFDVFPMWFAEGIAQFESSKRGADRWDTHRDMVMRMKASRGRFLPLEQMNIFIGKGMDFESGPYNQGFSMVRYLEETYGQGTIEKICRSCEKFWTLSFDMALKDAIGINMRQLYAEWETAEKTRYAKQRSALGPLVEGVPLVKDSSLNMGYRNLFPRWIPGDKKLFFLSNGPNDGGRAPLYVYDFCDTITKEADRLKLAFPGVNSFFTLSDSGKKVTSCLPSSRALTGEGYSDVFTITIPKTGFWEELKLALTPDTMIDGRQISRIASQMTRHDHAMQAGLNHKGDRVAVVRKIKNRYSLVLMTAENIIRDNAVNRLTRILFGVETPIRFRENREKKLVAPNPDSRSGYLLYGPRFSPNDSLVVFSYFDGKTQDIGLVDTAGNFSPLVATDADERDPDFTPDGRFVVFSSDRSGVFNLYRMELASGRIERLTQVAGGAFYPAVSYDGLKIAYANYDTSGFSIYIAENKPLSTNEDYPIASRMRPAEVHQDPEPTGFAGTSKYFPSLKRLIFSPMLVGEEMTSSQQDAKQGKFGVKAGGLLWFTDPLEKNSLMLMALMEVSKMKPWIGTSYGKHLFFNPQLDKDLMLLYENRSFTPTLNFEVDKFLIHQSDSFYNTVSSKYEPNNYVIDVQSYSATARFQLLSPFRKLHLGLHYNKQSVDFYDMDPNFALEYDVFRELNPTIYFTYLQMSGENGPWRQEDAIDTRGNYFKFKYDYISDDVIVDGSSFQESFEISSSGVLHPKYRTLNHQRLKLDFRHAGSMPFLPSLTWGGEAMATVADRPIDNFVYPGLFMKSYPFLADQAHLGFLGRNAARGELFVRFPVAKRIRKGFGIFVFDKIYGMAFVEGGLSAGIDSSENGRSDLDAANQGGRHVAYYMARLPVNANNYRARVTAPTESAIRDSIAYYSSATVFDERDLHMVYSSLPDDTVNGFVDNFKTLLNVPVRMGFGFELRSENYMVPGYPFFITLRYSQSVNRDDMAGSIKDYFTKSPSSNSGSSLYLNVGFSFDTWDLIDVPSANRRQGIRRF